MAATQVRGSTQLITGSVTDDELASGAVTAPKLDSNTVKLRTDSGTATFHATTGILITAGTDITVAATDANTVQISATGAGIDFAREKAIGDGIEDEFVLANRVIKANSDIVALNGVVQERANGTTEDYRLGYYNAVPTWVDSTTGDAGFDLVVKFNTAPATGDKVFISYSY